MGLTRVLILVAYGTVAAAAVGIVALTRYGNDSTLLAAATREGGPFETLSVLALLSLSAWSLVQSRRPGQLTMLRRMLVVVGLLALLGALEELSWGQHLVGFDTPAVLRDINFQGESNLHNLIDSQVFSALVHVPVYLLFVFPPLVLAVAPGLAARWPLSRVPAGWLADGHTVLIFCFGAALHDWRALVTLPDTVALLLALALFPLAARRGVFGAARGLWVHWLLVLGATAVFVNASAVFGYQNLQYEIRELIVVLGVFCWLTMAVRRHGSCQMER
ncbi:MAG: hypothetical protein PVG91_11255 [Gammaproteobacteria bacterium]|jgi:hypothetical protein